MTSLRWIRPILWALAALTALWSLWVLEEDRRESFRDVISTSAGPVVLYGTGDGPLVVISHGFAGSTQMMQVIAHDLARAGFRVAAFDFAGHGRNTALMSADVSRLDGTTRQLVTQTVAVTQAARAHLGYDGRIALLGHSMATDIIIRAAEQLDGIAALIALSMYSDAVTQERPSRLLILSGDRETRLRAVALEAVRMIDPTAQEGQTVQGQGVIRRAAVAPNVGHVGILYSTTTLQEVRAWLSDGLNHAPQGTPRSQARAILALLVSLVVLSSLAARLVPATSVARPALSLRCFLWALLAPVLPAVAASWALGGGVMGFAAFGHVLWFYLIWGGVTLAVLARFGHRLQSPGLWGVAILLGMCLGFGVALDRYGAAFWPTGPRAGLMAVLLIGTLPFMLADSLLASQASPWRRVVLRLVPLSALFGLMLLVPQDFGLLFTVLPVMLLFYIVFGTMSRAIAQRSGAETAGLALGVVLAWSIAASQPLFAALM